VPVNCKDTCPDFTLIQQVYYLAFIKQVNFSLNYHYVTSSWSFDIISDSKEEVLIGKSREFKYSLLDVIEHLNSI